MTRVTYPVLRRCAPGECAADCNCHVLTVDVGVDELTTAERVRFAAEGSAGQRAEVREYMAEEAA